MRCRKFLKIPGHAKTAEPSTQFRLNLPAVKRLGYNISRGNADGCPRRHVPKIMLVRADSGIADERRKNICRDAKLPAVAFAHEFRAGKSDCRVPRRKRVIPTSLEY